MKLTDYSRRALSYRRQVRDLRAEGYEEVNCSGGKLWELDRGFRYDHVIIDVVIGPSGKTLWIKTAERAKAAA